VKRQAPKALLDFHPRWSPDGTRIVFAPGAGRALMAIPVTLGPPLVFGSPTQMPRAPIPGLLSIDTRGFDLTRDGRIISVSSDSGDGASRPAAEVRVVINWFEELKRLAPAR
jgi:Tol biopolymer transport system component